jgi:ankyrin repeat protein
MQTALKLIAAAGPELTISQLCDALSFHEDNLYIDEDDVLDEDEIARICRSLIRKSNDGSHFEFAHFTVREFLESSSLLNTPLEKYHIAPDESWFLIDFCLRFIRLENFSKPLYTPTDILRALEGTYDVHPFYHFATWNWPFIFRSNYARLQDAKEQQLSDLIVSDPLIAAVLQQIDEFFCSDKSPAFLMWSANLAVNLRRYNYLFDTASYILPELLHAGFTPLHMACILTLEYPVLRLIGLKPRAPVPSSNFPSPAQCLLLGFPTLIYDRLSDSSTMEAMKDDLIVTHWMGVHTSYNIWGDLLKRLPTAMSLELEKVKIGSEEYSLLDFVCARARDPVRWAKDFSYFMRPGASLRQETVLRMQGSISSYQWPSDTEEQRQLLLYGLQNIDENADVLRNPDVLVNLRQLLADMRTMGNAHGGGNGQMTGALEDREYDMALELAIKYDHVVRLHELASDQRFHTYHNRQGMGRSLLHLAAALGSIGALDLLLTFGLDASSQDRDGNTPLHLSSKECIKTLVHHGVPDAARNHNNDTVWHIKARQDEFGLSILLNICSDLRNRLIEVNNDGFTPMTLAVYMAKEDNAILLLSHCQDVKAFVGPHPIYEAALRPSFERFIEALIAAKIPIEQGTSPVHRVSPLASVQCIRLLKSLCPGACSQRFNKRLPAEELLRKLPGFYDSFEKELLVEVLPGSDSQKVECWEYLCSQVLLSLKPDPKGVDVCLVFGPVLEVFLVQGVCEAYERHYNRPAALLLADVFLEHIGNPELAWDALGSLDSAVLDVLNGNQGHFGADLSSLFRLSVYVGWEKVMHELWNTTKAVDEAVYRSSLELACQPFNRCSLKTFELLLSKVPVQELNQLNLTSGLAPIHLLANEDVPARVQKLKNLLEKGVDPDVRCRRESEPALVYHIFERSFQTVQILLESHTKPQLTDDWGFDAPFAIVWVDGLESLRALRERYRETDWRKTITIHPEVCASDRCCTIVKAIEVQRCSLLHVAAAVGSLRCFQYLVEENLVSAINAKAGLGYTCAHFAATLSSDVCCRFLEYLASKSCDVNVLSDDDETPLDIAIKCNMAEDNIRTLQRIGARTADTRNVSSLRNVVKTPDGIGPSEDGSFVRLHEPSAIMKRELELLGDAIAAGDLPTCMQLHSHGCSLRHVIPGVGATPLFCAVAHKQSTIVQWLLKNGGGIWHQVPSLVGIIQFALSLPGCNGMLPALMHHFESMWPEWVVGDGNALIFAIVHSNIEGLRTVLDFVVDANQKTR